MGTNRPTWRMSGLRGGYYEPGRRMGIGTGLTPPSWQSQVIALDATQTAAFLSRHPDIKQKVDLFNTQVSISYFPEGFNYAIPSYGLAVKDSVFTNVVVFPDAHGVLRFTGNIPDNQRIEVNKPPFVSPPGTEPLPTWLTALLWIGAGLVGVTVLNTVKR